MAVQYQYQYLWLQLMRVYGEFVESSWFLYIFVYFFMAESQGESKVYQPIFMAARTFLCFPWKLSVLPFTCHILNMTKGQQDVFALEDYSQERGPTLTFSNLHYCVPESNWCRKKHPEKYILKDVRLVGTKYFCNVLKKMQWKSAFSNKINYKCCILWWFNLWCLRLV